MRKRSTNKVVNWEPDSLYAQNADYDHEKDPRVITYMGKYHHSLHGWLDVSLFFGLSRNESPDDEAEKGMYLLDVQDERGDNYVSNFGNLPKWFKTFEEGASITAMILGIPTLAMVTYHFPEPKRTAEQVRADEISNIKVELNHSKNELQRINQELARVAGILLKVIELI